MRSSCFNFLCCALTASFPHPHLFSPTRPSPVPSPLRPFISFTVYFGETTPLPDQSCCSFLDDCSYFPSPCERSRNGSVFAYPFIPVYLLCQRPHALSCPSPFCLFHDLCFERTILSFLSSSAHFLLSHRFSPSPLTCNSFTIPTQLATTTLSYRSRTPTHNGYHHAFSI